MRKTAALLLSIFLLFSMSVTAFAEDIIVDTAVPDSQTSRTSVLEV